MREPIAFVEIEQDFCNLTYGVAPCMAGIGVTGNTQCYNTLRTCQDTDSFSRGTKNLWFRDVSTRGASTEIGAWLVERSEEHTSELQSRGHLVCRLLLEEKKNHRAMADRLGRHSQS